MFFKVLIHANDKKEIKQNIAIPKKRELKSDD